jgi:hypothetical protein
VKLSPSALSFGVIEYARAVRTRIERKVRPDPDREIVYRELFLGQLARVGVADEFCLVDSTTSEGLMYLVARCMLELAPGHVLELGAGPTSVLLDRLAARVGRPCQITTIEHDADRARDIGASVSHPVVRVPLKPSGFYDLAGVFDTETPAPDFIVVGVPSAAMVATRASGLDAASWLAGAIGSEFVAVFDHAGRAAEARAVSAFRRLMADRGDRLFEGTVSAAGQQHIFCTRGFRAAADF